MAIEILPASASVLSVMNPSAAYPACFKSAGRRCRQIRVALDLVDREGCFHRPRPHGRAMARPLLDADHDTLIYNRTPETLAVLAGRGAKVAGSIAEAAAQGVVIAMLADDASTPSPGRRRSRRFDREPARRRHPCRDGRPQNDAIRSLTAAHQAAGQKLVAAPVLGRPAMVAAVRLGIIAAGPADARSSPAACTRRAGSAPCCGLQRRCSGERPLGQAAHRLCAGIENFDDFVPERAIS